MAKQIIINKKNIYFYYSKIGYTFKTYQYKQKNFKNIFNLIFIIIEENNYNLYNKNTVIKDKDNFN